MKTNIANNCIVIGKNAGKGRDIPDYSFIFTVANKWYGETEYGTIMTPEEFEVIHKVIMRCLKPLLSGN